MNAMLWIARTSAPWLDLPEYYDSWKSVYTRFRRWQMAGVWDQILEHVSIDQDFENVMIDATVSAFISMEPGQKGAAIPGDWTFPRGTTTKIHAIVDALGNPLRFELTGGQSYDCVTGYKRLKWMVLRRTNILADRGYDTNAILNLLQDNTLIR